MSERQTRFPRAARLLGSSQYKAVFQCGDKFVCDGFVVIATANRVGHARLGLALAKRRIRRAVDRNRVKRAARESFRFVRNELPAVDIVVLARSRTAATGNATLRAQLDCIWSRLAGR